MNNKKSGSIGTVTLTLMVIGSMIGAGLLVVPNQMMSYGFGGTLGWILAAFCSFVLAKVFTDISLSSEGKGGLIDIIERQYGKQAAFVAGFAQWGLLVIGSAAILFGLMSYLCEFYHITSDVTKFFVSSGLLISIMLMHILTNSTMKIMSFFTIIKILLFSTCALLGFTEFNPLKVFGFMPTGNIASDVNTVIAGAGGLFPLIASTFQAASVAMFAFAGIENAASANNVRNPKISVPIATMVGCAVASVIYLLTHICVVNASGVYSETPVKFALVQLSSFRFGAGVGEFLGGCVSIVAVLGCFGTLLALGQVVPNVLVSTLKIPSPDFKTPTSRTGMPYLTGIISTALMIGIMAIKYIFGVNIDDLLGTYTYMLVYVYLQCVFAHFSGLKRTFYSIAGLFAVTILILGCRPQSVFYGVLIIEILGKSLFALLGRKRSISAD